MPDVANEDRGPDAASQPDDRRARRAARVVMASLLRCPERPLEAPNDRPAGRHGKCDGTGRVSGPEKWRRRAGISEPEAHQDLRAAVTAVSARFPDEYWRDLAARREYPEAFVQAMTEAGFLAALIPEEYGGMGLGIADTSVILEEINRSGGDAQPAHAQVYTMGTLLRHGSEEQRRKYLPRIVDGEIRLQAFWGDRTRGRNRHTSLRTTAVRRGTRTSSTAARCSSRASSTPTSGSCSRARRRARR
jgi:hypothetical protein